MFDNIAQAQATRDDAYQSPPFAVGYTPTVAPPTVADIAARAVWAHDLNERGMVRLLNDAATIADACDPALALLCRVLADCPLEVAAAWTPNVDALAQRLHPDTDAPALCRAVAVALAAHAEETARPSRWRAP